MALPPGTRLGVYEVTAQIGAGGMGEVYKGRDTRLDRTVAIKVLPEALAADPEFRERFDREARTISRLAHPNICTLFDVGEEAGTAFLVMELLEGETLESRCARARAKGSGLPFDDALRIAVQIADALAAAHRLGIVHRDLKPGNIFLVRSGGASAAIAKLLDFGLARTAAALTVNAATSAPTMPPEAMTARGTILGTFQYMAPEQVEGGQTDARTDIFAFGSVLYEMITGKKAFEGKTQTNLVAAILERDPPPLTTVQPLVPPLVDSIVRKCVAKNPDDRWQTASDLGSALRWAAEGANATTSGATAVAGTPRTSTRRVANGAVAAATILGSVAIGLAVGGRYLSTVATPAAPVRFEVQPPANVTLSPAPIASAAQLALSPDGRRLAFVAARTHAASQLWVRPLDEVEAQPLPGTEGASYPFWSPDGRFIAFFAGGKLKKIDTTGGVPQVLCPSGAGRGGAWNREGIILFVGQGNSPISRISASGGMVTAATTFDPGQAVIGQAWPQFLPDGRHFLYFQRSSKPEHRGVHVTALDSSSSTRILDSDGMAVYASGRLLFVRDGTLFAQAFDDRALQTSGDPVRIGDQVGYWTAGLGYAAVTASPSGVLAHGPSVRLTTSLRWHDRSGASTGPSTAPAQYTTPRLSPDQMSVVVAMTDDATAQPDLWVLGLARGTASRLTSDPATDWFPAWSADGSGLFFGSNRMGVTTPFQKAVGAPEEPAAESLFRAAGATSPSDISGDGRLLLYVQLSQRGYDLGVLTLTGERKASTFLGTAFNEAQARFSPNTRWVAYASDESGRFEVYVRPFPAASGQTQISIAGGTQPEWRRDGKELFYISADGKLTAVPVTTDGATFSAGTPLGLFDVEVPEPNPPFPTDYAVTADGQRFLVNTVVDQPTRPALTVILNWTSGLKK
ncbi:MAG TPA: protein kinase [Vicinamibacterales bacterium]|nr:protein kinase [Vicinamibacterales bacterium]